MSKAHPAAAVASPFASLVEPARVLVVDDDPAMCAMLELDLTLRGVEVKTLTRVPAAVDFLRNQSESIDVLVTDLNLGRSSGLELVQAAVTEQLEVPVVVVTAFGSIDSAVHAIRLGAYDFITKPFELDVLALTILRAVEHGRLRRELRRLKHAVAAPHARALIGNSAAMQRVCSLVSRLAEVDATVLVTGESGTGKELVARALHQESRRSKRPLVAMNCGAVPEHLLESELFGHVRGAFTDARSDRDGVFREADGGTLFLDEIGELPLGLQPKLLRVLQERVVRPIGGSKEVAVDVRIVAATNRDLEHAIKQGTFREDLFFRINVVGIELPPLRSRGNDVLLLAQFFLNQFATKLGQPVRKLKPEAATALLAHDWPGNVRELQNVIERAITISEGDELGLAELPEKLRRATPPRVDLENDTPILSLAEVERRHLLTVLDRVNGNKRKASALLGLDRSTLYRKLKEFGLEDNEAS